MRNKRNLSFSRKNGGGWPLIYQPDQSITAALGTLYCHPYIQAIPNNTNGNFPTLTSISKGNGIKKLEATSTTNNQYLASISQDV